jgi:AraC-like DNA-binding protein
MIMDKKRPDLLFLQRLLGNDIQQGIKQYDLPITSGIQLYYADVLLQSNQDARDEAAFLNFYPVDDNNYYLQLSFLPECLSQEEQEYRVIQLVFSPEFFHQWPQGIINGKQPFRFDRSAEQTFTLNNASQEALELLFKSVRQVPSDFIQALRLQEAIFYLLRYALEAFLIPDEANKLPACSFLSNNTERNKVLEAEQIILQNLEHPLTIKELSRQVGMNECYLKKGFKATFRKTIHEYQQAKRIDKAKQLLLQGVYSINEVAYKMGYGSASHFSTSFKKIAGMKPCELLR